MPTVEQNKIFRGRGSVEMMLKQPELSELSGEHLEFLRIYYNRRNLNLSGYRICDYAAQFIFGDKGSRGKIKNLAKELAKLDYVEVTDAVNGFRLRDTSKGREFYEKNLMTEAGK